MRDLNGRVAILTGASRGLGVDVARALAKAGCDLALAARSQTELEQVAEEIRGMGRRTIAVPCDVSSSDDRKRLVDATLAEFGKIDVLVNNAGIELTAFYEEQPEEEIAHLINVNLTSAMLLTRAVLPHMLERKSGHIVNMASLAGKVPVPYSVPYSTSKAGMIAFTEGIRNEFKGRGVSASVICPGFVSDAGMYADWEKESGVKATALTRPVSPQRVANNVVKAIQRNRPEMLVFWMPARATAALAEIAPGTFERIFPVFGSIKVFRKLAEYRQKQEKAAEKEAEKV
jgi:short-subunit dehydrogenase